MPVQDQGSCGSCYAFAAAAVAGERLCIERGQQSAPLSQQELVSCGSSTMEDYRTPWCMLDPSGAVQKTFTNGCEGATSFNSLMYLHMFGLPTRECIPYTSGGGGSGIHHFETGSGGHVPTCASIEGHSCRVDRSMHRTSLPIPCPPGEVTCIKNAIFEKGPVLASFMVTEEFRSGYPSNDPEYVYKGSSCDNPETPVGGHAVAIHGWGITSDGLQYWLVRNSWGTSWGDQGVFKIAFGVQNIEEDVLYVSPDPKERSHMDGECVKVVAEGGGSCRIKNECEGQVRSVDIEYYGTDENCGSWSTQRDDWYPLQEETVAGYFCYISRDDFVKEVPKEKYYVDYTKKYPSYGCVLKNTYDGPGIARFCCGNICHRCSAGGLAIFPTYLCSEDECASQRGGTLYETVDDE
jgi:cathepsin B